MKKKLCLMILTLCVLLLMVGVVSADEIDDIIPFVIQVESGGRAEAVSKAGAIGLMQLMPCVLKEWNNEMAGKWSPFVAKFSFTHYNLNRFQGDTMQGYRDVPLPHFRIEELKDKEINVILGEWYLRRLKNHYLKDNYTMERLLCGWNGGITKLRRYKYDCSKMPRESRNFSKKVINAYRKSQIR